MLSQTRTSSQSIKVRFFQFLESKVHRVSLEVYKNILYLGIRPKTRKIDMDEVLEYKLDENELNSKTWNKIRNLEILNHVESISEIECQFEVVD